MSNFDRIFALEPSQRLFSVRHLDVEYEEEQDHELTRHYKLWEDPEYLLNFYCENVEDLSATSYYGRVGQEDFIQRTYDYAQRYRRAIDAVVASPNVADLSLLFQPLRDDEHHRLLAKVKLGGWLRIYGVRTRNDLFFIIGGAIKLNHLMSDRDHLMKQLERMKAARRDISKLLREGELFTLIV